MYFVPMQQVQHIISFHGNLPSHMNSKASSLNAFVECGNFYEMIIKIALQRAEVV